MDNDNSRTMLLFCNGHCNLHNVDFTSLQQSTKVQEVARCFAMKYDKEQHKSRVKGGEGDGRNAVRDDYVAVS